MDPLTLGLIMGGSSLLGGALNIFGQSSANEAAAAQTQQQEDFQNYESSTAYQRATTDMKNAGLNPMMMFGSGSAESSPVGSAAPVGNVFSNNGVQQAGQGIVQSALQKNQIDISQQNADSQSQSSEAAMHQADAAMVKANNDSNVSDQQVANMASQKKLIDAQADIATASSAAAQAELPAQLKAAAANNDWAKFDNTWKRVKEIIQPLSSAAAGAAKAASGAPSFSLGD